MSHLLLQRALRKKKKDFHGFSLRWMAQQLDVSHAYLSQIFSGKREVPMRMVDPFCQILDLDTEARAKIYQDLLKNRGVTSLSGSNHRVKRTTMAEWELTPTRDFDLITRAHCVSILMTTLLETYDGTASYIAGRLQIPKSTIESTMELLEKRGYLTLQEGVLKASKRYFDFQSQTSKEHMRTYHKSVMQKAREVLETQKTQEALERRLITSATMTCSREDVEKLKLKIADFLKEFTEEAAAGAPQEVYQFGLQFFPATEPG